MSARNSDDGFPSSSRQHQRRDGSDNREGLHDIRGENDIPKLRLHKYGKGFPTAGRAEVKREEDYIRQERDYVRRERQRRSLSWEDTRRAEEGNRHSHDQLEGEGSLRGRVEDARRKRMAEEGKSKERIEKEQRLKRKEEEKLEARIEEEEWIKRAVEEKYKEWTQRKNLERSGEGQRRGEEQDREKHEQSSTQNVLGSESDPRLGIISEPSKRFSPPGRAVPVRLPRYRDRTAKQRKARSRMPSIFDEDGFLIPRARDESIRGIEDHLNSGDLPSVLRTLTALSDDKSPAPTLGHDQLQELQGRCKSNATVAELLFDDAIGSPWIISSVDSIVPVVNNRKPLLQQHYKHCVHRLAGMASGKAEARISSKSSTLEKPDLSQACGLAGLGPDLDIGSADFAGADYGIVNVHYDGHWPRYLLASIYEVVKRASSAVTLLQEANLCCDSITVLCLPRITHVPDKGRKPTARNCIELCRVDLSLLLHFSMALDNAIQKYRKDPTRAFKTLCIAASDILSIPSRLVANQTTSGTQSDEFVALHLASLAAQFMAVAIQSYGQAHMGRMHPSCLLESLHEITLCGTQGVRDNDTPLRLHFQLQPLACLEGMMPEGVMVVVDDAGAAELCSMERPLEIMSTAVAFVDTWDDSKLIFDDTSSNRDNIACIRAGGGVIALTTRPADQMPSGVEAAHWTAGNVMQIEKKQPFSADTRLMIGATSVTVNETCTLDESSLFVEAETRCQLDKICTSQDAWENTTRTVGLTAGQYISANFNNAYTKRPGVTLKQAYMEAFATDLILRPILESTWGMQLSLCTGVARRVPMYTLVADTMAAFAESSLHEPTWKQLTRRHDVVGKLRDNKLKELLTDLRNKPKYRETLELIIKAILNTMRHTGIDSSNGTLTVSWPHEDDPLACMKFRCDEMSLWTKILADTPEVATFAYITPQCLENDTRSCTRAHRNTWRLRPYMLHTAVNVDNRADREGPRHRLRPAQEYSIGKESLYLRARPVSFHDGLPCVYVTQSKLWGSMQRRLAHLEKTRGLYLCLQERRRMAVPAKDVMILTSVPAEQVRRSLSSSSSESNVKTYSTARRSRHTGSRSRRSTSRRRLPQSQTHDFCKCTVM